MDTRLDPVPRGERAFDQGGSRISFVLPSLSRSGGSRVTVEMGNHLVDRGYDVRILYAEKSASFRDCARACVLRASGVHYQNWGRQFKGGLERFSCLDRVLFDRGEMVVAVGTDAIPLVRALRQDVATVRYCHGFSFDRPALSRDVWSGPMPTIAVSSTLGPQLEAFGCEGFLGVVPNGICLDAYYPERRQRDGIGMVFGMHCSKAPEDSLRLLSLIMGRWPDVPLYVFGAARRPRGLPRRFYTRYPSIGKARELYNRSKVWLMASRAEGFGMPNLEAMACGAALISTNNLGSAEVVDHGRNGLLVPVGEPEAFLEPLDVLLNHEARRRELVLEGYRTAQYFNWDRAADCMEQLVILRHADAHDRSGDVKLVASL